MGTIYLDDDDSAQLFFEEAEKKKKAVDHIDANPESTDQGLAKIVLTVIELLRRLMEKQAVQRIENGSLTDSQIEEMGETFMKLEEKMEELKRVFNLTSEDLNLNLGPLGDLM